MKHSRIILIASLLAITASIFIFSFRHLTDPEDSNEPQNTINTTIEIKNPEIKTLPPRDNTLARFQKTRMENVPGPYKKLTVSDGEVTFSFEVPDAWLTELRNSGELAMNEAEMRDFWATDYFVDIRTPNHGGPEGGYWDFTWNEFEKKSFPELQSLFDQMSDYGNFPGVPNASTSMMPYIRYTDTSDGQIDFFIAKNKDLPSRYKYVYESIHNKEVQSGVTNGIAYKKIVFPKTDEPATGGAYVFTSLNSKKTLIIKKQKSPTEEFDKDFQRLIDTLQLEQ